MNEHDDDDDSSNNNNNNNNNTASYGKRGCTETFNQNIKERNDISD